jgi:hypothetical protein
MNSKLLIRLAAVAVVALIAALWIGARREPGTEIDGRRALVPGLKDAINDVATVRLLGADTKPLATLTKGEHGWSVAERGGYGADAGKVREFLLKLADAELIEAKTANPELHKKLGVEDPSQKDAASVQVELVGGKAASKVIIGRFNGLGGDGTFVRAANDPQVWLAKGNLTVDKNAADWLKKDLTDIPSNRIQSVELTRDGKTLTVSKANSSDANYQVADLPKGRELSSEFAANGLASLLAGLKFDDVAKRDTAPPPDASAVRNARYVGFDGLIVSAQAWEKDGKDYAWFEASLDEAKAKADIARQQAKDKSEYEAKKAEFEAKAKAASAKPAEPAATAANAANAAKPSADAGAAKPADKDAAKKDEAPVAPLAVTDPAKDEELRLGRVKQEVADLNARFAGWLFTLPNYKYANINRGMDDLLKPLESKTAEAKDVKKAADKGAKKADDKGAKKPDDKGAAKADR